MSPTSAALATSEAGPAEIPLLIDGNWRAASESYAVRDPYRNTIVSHAPRSSLTDLDDALNIDEVFRFVSDSRFGLQTASSPSRPRPRSGPSATSAPAASSSMAVRPGAPTNSPMAASRTQASAAKAPAIRSAT